MPPLFSALRHLGSHTTLALLSSAASPGSGAAQTTGGFTTSLGMAAGAAIRAITEPAYPAARYAGRDEAGVPRYILRPFTAEERHLLRRHFGI